MQYMGSKNSISEYIVPILQDEIEKNEIKCYVEPFVGGANIIDKIKCKKKIGIDIHEELIELLKYTQNHELPQTITEEEYYEVKKNKWKYEKWYLGFVGFCCSFGSKYFAGFARGNDKRDRVNEAKRNLERQNLKNIQFECGNYDSISFKKALIYCDPPYEGVKNYNSTEKFDKNKLIEWCLEEAKENIVYLSEYDIRHPNFKEVWSIQHYKSLGSGINLKSKKSIEKLYKVEI